LKKESDPKTTNITPQMEKFSLEQSAVIQNLKQSVVDYNPKPTRHEKSPSSKMSSFSIGESEL
jgi:hypothetical protein